MHMIAHSLQDGSTAHGLRHQIANWVAVNADTQISESPVKDWVQWDAGINVESYAAKMQGHAWGGGIEMAAVSRLKHVNVFVYQSTGTGYKRISCFESGSSASTKAVRILYQGGVHYDALEMLDGTSSGPGSRY